MVMHIVTVWARIINQLPINRPKVEVNNYQRDGQMRLTITVAGSVYYEPNSFGGPTESPENKQAAFRFRSC